MVVSLLDFWISRVFYSFPFVSNFFFGFDGKYCHFQHSISFFSYCLVKESRLLDDSFCKTNFCKEGNIHGG
jgi:hypothetical protein